MAKNRKISGRATVAADTRRIPKRKGGLVGKVRGKDNIVGRKSSDISTDELSLSNPPIRGTDLMNFNRGMFMDPFFSDIEDMFNFNPFSLTPTINNMMSNLRTRATDFRHDHGLDPETLHTPGTYHSKSQYRRTIKKEGNKSGGEHITHEKTVYIDDRGKKYIEKNKTYEDDAGNTRKMTKSRYIGDRGVKHMITHNLKTDEEYIHDEFKGMNEGQLENFNAEFERGVKNAKRFGSEMLGSESGSPRSLGSDSSRKRIGS
jgi:hypothetical protein